MTNESITYKDAGVDIDASNAAKKRIRQLARDTFTPGVLSDIGAFGGITENLNRILPDGCQAEVQLGSWPVLPLCRVMAEIGKIERDEMLRATNMGIGMVIVVRPSNYAVLAATLKTLHFQIGRIVPGEPRVTYRT